jgi:hypothetical protein
MSKRSREDQSHCSCCQDLTEPILIS